jgi:hypothetical protein
MKKRLFTFLTLAIAAIALGFSPQLTSVSFVSAEEQDGSRRDGSRDTLVLDVACDARTFAVNGGRTIFDAKRGDGFIVKGKIYPGGTIPRGGTMENPGPFDPDTAPGSIGNWICRGAFEFDIGQILNGAEPHVYSTQYHLLNDGNGLVTDGPEGGPQVRSLIGGMGAYAGAIADVTEEPLGVNSTGLFNLRFTFKFKKKADR